jgi:hypothetical protein
MSSTPLTQIAAEIVLNKMGPVLLPGMGALWKMKKSFQLLKIKKTGCVLFLRQTLSGSYLKVFTVVIFYFTVTRACFSVTYQGPMLYSFLRP